MNPLDFENLNGTHLQHELMHETIEGLDALAILNKHAQTYGNCGSTFQNNVSTLTLFAQAAQEFNSECDITASMHCINTLHSGLEIIVEGVRGIGIGLNNLGSMIAHPIDTAQNLLNFTKSIAWGLQEVARYCLFDRTFDTQRARKTESQAQEFLEDVANHIYYSCYESSPGDYARIATEQYTILKAPGALLDAVCAGANIAKNFPITANTESEMGLFLKNSMIDESYAQIASEITEGIRVKSKSVQLFEGILKEKSILDLINEEKIVLEKLHLISDAERQSLRAFISKNLILPLETPNAMKNCINDIKIKISHLIGLS